MDEETYFKLLDDALDRERDEETETHEKSPWEEAREDIERETMDKIRREWN